MLGVKPDNFSASACNILINVCEVSELMIMMNWYAFAKKVRWKPPQTPLWLRHWYLAQFICGSFAFCGMVKRWLCRISVSPLAVLFFFRQQGTGDTSGGCRCRVGGKPCVPHCGNCHWTTHTRTHVRAHAFYLHIFAKLLHLLSAITNSLLIFTHPSKAINFLRKPCLTSPLLFSPVKNIYASSSLS